MGFGFSPPQGFTATAIVDQGSVISGATANGILFANASSQLDSDAGALYTGAAPTVASAASAVLNNISYPARTVTVSGGTNITTATGFNLLNIGIPDISTTVTITSAATLAIQGAPTVSGGGAITNKLALWAVGGDVQFGPTVGSGFFFNGSTNVLTVGAVTIGSVVTVGNTVLGMHSPSANNLAFVTQSVRRISINVTRTAFYETNTGSSVELCNGSPLGFAADGNTATLYLNRKATASLQLGLTSSGSATNQTFGAHDTTGANKTGANLTNTAGNGTGTGGSGLWIVSAAPASTTSSTANTFAALLTLSGGKNTGTQQKFIYTGQADLNLTLSTEVVGVNYNLSATREWATGAITTQREFLVQAPTYGFVGASTIDDAATVAITAAPIAGTNATITRGMALWVQGGQTRIQSLRMDGQSTGAGVAVGTLTNAPSAGDPDFWLPVNIAGTAGWVPVWYA